jgi:hypothetical protein
MNTSAPQPLLKLNAADARKIDIEDQATGTCGRLSLQELFR